MVSNFHSTTEDMIQIVQKLIIAMHAAVTNVIPHMAKGPTFLKDGRVLARPWENARLLTS